METIYIIGLFDLNTDELVREIEVPNISSDDFNEIFGITNGIDYGCAPIEAKHVDKLRKFISVDFELDKFYYSMELVQVK
jgi:hypothetical protein